MSDETKIEWADMTGSPWYGCTEVSPGCANCYAKELAQSRMEGIIRRAYRKAEYADWETRPVWGNKAVRVLSRSFWKDALEWQENAGGFRQAGRRCPRAFPSLDDWLDEMPAGIVDQDGVKLDPVKVRAEFLSLIARTPDVDWLLLTKRPERFTECMCGILADLDYRSLAQMTAAKWLREMPPENVWVGTSAEDQKRLNERVPHLLMIPAKLRFLSLEPLLGPIRAQKVQLNDVMKVAALKGEFKGKRIDWAIVGGESGPHARPCNIDWIRALVKEAKEEGAPIFVKQLGALPYEQLKTIGEWLTPFPLNLKHPKGGDPAEWPEDLRVREFPKL